MSLVVCFEFQSEESNEKIKEKIANIWQGEGQCVDIHSYEAKESFFCYLEWYSGAKKEQQMVEAIIKYLFSITSDEKIYYYPDSTHSSLCKLYPQSIKVSDIFTKYPPQICASEGDFKYLLKESESDN